VCCSVLQCVVVCCSVLQRVAVRWRYQGTRTNVPAPNNRRRKYSGKHGKLMTPKESCGVNQKWLTAQDIKTPHTCSTITRDTLRIPMTSEAFLMKEAATKSTPCVSEDCERGVRRDGVGKQKERARAREATGRVSGMDAERGRRQRGLEKGRCICVYIDRDIQICITGEQAREPRGGMKGQAHIRACVCLCVS